MPVRHSRKTLLAVLTEALAIDGDGRDRMIASTEVKRVGTKHGPSTPGNFSNRQRALSEKFLFRKIRVSKMKQKNTVML
jgi:hypothetical protein